MLLSSYYAKTETTTSTCTTRRRNKRERFRFPALSSVQIAVLFIISISFLADSSKFKCVGASSSTSTRSDNGTGAASNNNHFNWREWNYYQILALAPDDYYYPSSSSSSPSSSSSSSSPVQPIYTLASRRTRRQERTSITKKEIKKAYRRQAQMWHPDKIMNRRQQHQDQDQKQNDGRGGSGSGGNANTYTNANTNENGHKSSTSGNNNNNNNNNNNKSDHMKDITIEECNARFAKIAEAYEVLIDDEKRLEYDEYLLDFEDETKRKLDRQRKMNNQNNYYYQNKGEGQGQGETASSSMFEGFFKSNFDNFNPMNVFDDFFFGSMNDEYGSSNGHSHSNSRGTKFTINDLFESFFGEDLYNTQSDSSSAFNSDNHHYQYQHRQPDRVSEATQIRYDATIQQEIIRVLHREEYDDHEDPRRVYYRVLGQEFVEDFDFYNGISLGYSPISEVYFVEDGYTAASTASTTSSFHNQKQQRDYHYQHYHSNDFDYEGDDYSYKSHQNQNQQRQQNQRQRQLKNQTSSIMKSNEYITPSQNKIFLKSKNNQYYSGLTAECELVIMQVNSNKNYGLYDIDEDFVIWSSGTYLPKQYQGRGCAFAIYNGRIAVVAGNDIDRPTAILWNSPIVPIVPGSVVGGDDDDSEDIIEYYVSLDDDGSLSVYRSRMKDDDKNDDLIRITKRWWKDLVSGESTIPSKTKATETWRFLQKWFNTKLLSKPKESPYYDEDDEHENYNGSTKQRHNQRTNQSQYNRQKRKLRDECVFATGPAGCLTPGRYFVQISKDMKRTFEKAMEDLVDVVSEGSEDDIDAFDTATRVVTKTGRYLGLVTLRAIKENAHVIRLWTSKVQKILGMTMRRLKDIWYDSEIMNLLYKQAERLKDFLFEVQ